MRVFCSISNVHLKKVKIQKSTKNLFSVYVEEKEARLTNKFSAVAKAILDENIIIFESKMGRVGTGNGPSCLSQVGRLGTGDERSWLHRMGRDG